MPLRGLFYFINRFHLTYFYRLDTDIMFGNRFGMHTACLMTGVTSKELLNKVMSTPEDVQLRPNLVYESAGHLLDAVRLADKSN